MVYLTGDTHGDIDIGKLSRNNWKQEKTLTDKDYLIILGDFGLPFLDKEIQDDGSPAKGSYKYWIKWLSEKQYTILWVDGNHENFNFWKKQPVSEWHGGKVQIHPHAKNILHLMRGEIYDIEGKSYLSFGGAPSQDKECRINQIDWWPEEEASYAEMQNAIDHLEQHQNKVDFILTHTIPKTWMEKKFQYETSSPTEKFLDELANRVDYKIWFAGHFHMNALFPEQKAYVLYNAIYDMNHCQKKMKSITKQFVEKG